MTLAIGSTISATMSCYSQGQLEAAGYYLRGSYISHPWTRENPGAGASAKCVRSLASDGRTTILNSLRKLSCLQTASLRRKS
jgi:hypothetical protein